MRSPIAGHRALRWGLGIALACSLAPAAALAQPLLSEAIAGATARSADTEQPAQTAVPGQALVLYHASDRASVDTLDSSSADELTGAGFGVVQEWDFSAVDRALEEGAIEPQTAEGSTGDVPEGSDLRVALVERDGADADDLAAELEALDFVVAAQPNYIVSVDASAPSSPRPRSERSSSRASRLLRSLPSRMTARSTCSVRSAAGVSITSATVFDGCVHLTAFDHGTDAASATGALYTLPRATAEQLANIACPTERYTDLDASAWYHEPVDWAVAQGIMLGTDVDAGIFDPTDTLTRAQMAQILYNMAGSPAVEGSAPYTDCEQGAWYDAAVTWCAQEGIFQGYDGTSLFGPDDLLSREQMAVVLWRMAGTASADGDLSHFVDGASVSDWAADGVSWAVGEGYLRGIGGTSELRPQDGLERAQAATVLMRADRAGFPFPEPAEQPR